MTDKHIPAVANPQLFQATPIEAGCVDELPTTISGSLRDEYDDLRKRNRIRAEFAITALRAYAETVGGSNSEPLDTMIGDLLSDMRHLCDALNQTDSLESSFNGLLDSSERRYDEELHGEW